MYFIFIIRYRVHPHHGEIAVGSEVFIVITLLPFQYQPRQEYNDKFGLQVKNILSLLCCSKLISFWIQLCARTELNMNHSQSNVWIKVPDETIQCKKFRCRFIYQDGSDSSKSTKVMASAPPAEQVPESDGACGFHLPSIKDATKKESNEDSACIVCMEKPQEYILVPCGHAQYCEECAKQLRSGQLGCAVCRLPIERVIKVYRWKFPSHLVANINIEHYNYDCKF